MTGMLSIVSLANLKSLRLAASAAKPMGTPCPSHNTLRLAPCLARSVGLGPVFFPAQRGFGHRTVHGLPRPVDSLQFVELHQSPGPQLQKRPGLCPFLEPPLGRG